MKNVTNHQPDLLECYMRLRWIHAYRERAPHATCTQMPADAGRLGIRTMQQNHQLSIFAPAGLSQLVVLDLGTATWSSSHWKSSSIRLRHLIPPNSEWQKPLKICLNCGPFKGFKIKVPSYWYNQSRESATPGVSPRSLICLLGFGIPNDAIFQLKSVPWDVGWWSAWSWQPNLIDLR